METKSPSPFVFRLEYSARHIGQAQASGRDTCEARNKEALPVERQGLQDSHHPHACRFRSRSSDLTTSGAHPDILSGSECDRHEQVTFDVTERNKANLQERLRLASDH